MNKILLSILQSLIVPLLEKILEKLTPVIREELVSFLQGWYLRALSTENEVDNWLSKFILNVLSIPLPDVPDVPEIEKIKTLADTIEDLDPSLLLGGKK